MPDLPGTPSEKRKDAVNAALLKDPKVKYFEPYIIIHEKGVGIQILLAEGVGIRKLFEHKV